MVHKLRLAHGNHPWATASWAHYEAFANSGREPMYCILASRLRPFDILTDVDCWRNSLIWNCTLYINLTLDRKSYLIYESWIEYDLLLLIVWSCSRFDEGSQSPILVPHCNSYSSLWLLVRIKLKSVLEKRPFEIKSCISVVIVITLHVKEYSFNGDLVTIVGLI